MLLLLLLRKACRLPHAVAAEVAVLPTAAAAAKRMNQPPAVHGDVLAEAAGAPTAAAAMTLVGG